jgi:two-component system response regulator CpxR
MRPRKTILVVNANEDELGVQQYMLQVRGYRVMVAHDAAAALALAALGVDLVLGFADGMLKDWKELAEGMKRDQPNLPILLVTKLDSAYMRGALAPAADTVEVRTNAMDLVERVRTVIARKRGPRKKLEMVPALAGD